MRRNVIAALALMLWGVGFTAAAVAQQPVKLGVLNDQSGLYADLSGMGSVHAARMAVEDFGGKRWDTSSLLARLEHADVKKG